MDEKIQQLIEPLRRSMGQLEAALSRVEDSIAIIDHQYCLLWCNKPFEKFTDKQRLFLLGQPIDQCTPDFLDLSIGQLISSRLADKDDCNIDVNTQTASKTHHLKFELHRFEEASGEQFYVVVITDISSQYEIQVLEKQALELRERSERCELTSLLNRRGLEKEIDFVFAEDLNARLALIFCDVNKFKSINDNYGHDVGDKVLVYIANVLSNGIRPCDFVGRLSGDEFILGIIDEDPLVAAKTVLERVLKKLNKPFSLSRGGEKFSGLNTSLSFGIVNGASATDRKVLMKKADFAMYYAKENGLDYYIYSEKDALFSEEDLELEEFYSHVVRHLQIPVAYSSILMPSSPSCLGHSVHVGQFNSSVRSFSAEELASFFRGKGSSSLLALAVYKTLLGEISSISFSGDAPLLLVPLDPSLLKNSRILKSLFDLLAASKLLGLSLALKIPFPVLASLPQPELDLANKLREEGFVVVLSNVEDATVSDVFADYMFDGAQVSYSFVDRCLGVDSGGLFLGSVLALLRAQVSFSVLSDVPKVDFDSALRICKDYGFDFVQMSELV